MAGPLRSIAGDVGYTTSKANKTLDDAQRFIATLQNLLNNTIKGDWIPVIDSKVVTDGNTIDITTHITFKTKESIEKEKKAKD